MDGSRLGLGLGSGWRTGTAGRQNRVILSAAFFSFSPPCLSELVLVFSFLISLSTSSILSIGWLVSLSHSLLFPSGKRNSILSLFFIHSSLPPLSLLIIQSSNYPSFYSSSHLFSLYSSLLLDGEKMVRTMEEVFLFNCWRGKEKDRAYLSFSLSLTFSLLSIFLDRLVVQYWFQFSLLNSSRQAIVWWASGKSSTLSASAGDCPALSYACPLTWSVCFPIRGFSLVAFSYLWGVYPIEFGLYPSFWPAVWPG